MKIKQWLWRAPLLVLLYLVLFTLGADMLGPQVDMSQNTPAEQQLSRLMLLLMSVIDVALVSVLIRRSRLSGWRLMVLVGVFFYFVKTFTSSLEAAYFMQNVSAQMLPALFTMTLPVSLLFPPLAVWILGRLHASPDEQIEWQPEPMGRPELWGKMLLLSALVYPILFFGFGYFIAYQSAEVRAFYGDSGALSFLEHMAKAYRTDPLLVPFEVLRGALWVAAAWVVLRTTSGPWWHGALLVALCFAILQNDVHLLPNPLMAANIRLFHFVETASSNFINAMLIGWLLSRTHLSAPGAHHSRELGSRHSREGGNPGVVGN